MTTRDRLLALETFGIKLGLENIRLLVSALGHPERGYPTVHVAGTNGKGSVCAIVERTLRAAGYRTGLYTSPHLDRLEERMALDGAPVDEDAFEASARRVLAVADDAQADGRLAVSPTFFEVTTAIAFDVFREAGVDVAVIEVGLGGRFDATNVIVPRVAAITSIAFDHERHLGTTLAAIAGEKAGIAKPGVPIVVAALPPEAAAVVERVAAQAGAPLVPGADGVELLEVTRGRARVRPHVERWSRLPAVELSLLGRHQVANAATAVRVIDVLDAAGLRVPPAALATGLAHARWPARLEWLRLAEGDLLIDAAHNPNGAEALAAYLRDLGGPPMPIVLAAMQDKDIAGMVRPLAGLVSRFVTTGVATPRAFRPEQLAGRIRELHPAATVTVVADARDAIRDALAGGGRAVAAGSIYFVGPLRARLLESGSTPI